MKVDQLPVEILMKIFSYLTTYKEVSLVNHLFYNVVCKVNDSNICVSLYYSLFENEEELPLLQSVMNTNRKISKLGFVAVSPSNIKMLAVLKKFSSTITDLTLHAMHVQEISDFVHILSLVPNAEHLTLTYLSIRTQEPDRQLSEEKRRIDGDNEDLNLNQLKSLQCYGCDDKILVVFDRLPPGVLTEFTFDIHNFLQLGTLFKRQKNIKKLREYHDIEEEEFTRKRKLVVAVDYFDHLELESLNWHQNMYDINIASTLSKQPKLKSLSLDTVDANVMNVVGNQLTELESLSIRDISAPATSIVNVNKLKNLKCLKLQGVNNVALANLDNSRIIFLDISFSMNFRIDQIQALAKRAPNLKSLRCKFNRISIFNAVTRYFNFVEVLRFRGYPEPIHDMHFGQDCTPNPKLIELIINGELHYDTPFLEEMIVKYSNLKKLAIKSSIPLTDSQFKRILDGFPKLESLLLITGASMLTIDALNYLNHHKNVTFISLEDLHLKLECRHVKQLSAMFDVVVNSEKFAMAVDTKTMKRESLLLL